MPVPLLCPTALSDTDQASHTLVVERPEPLTYAVLLQMVQARLAQPQATLQDPPAPAPDSATSGEPGTPHVSGTTM